MGLYNEVEQRSPLHDLTDQSLCYGIIILKEQKRLVQSSIPTLKASTVAYVLSVLILIVQSLKSFLNLEGIASFLIWLT